MKDLMGYVYILLFSNGKRYVGQTIGTVENRLKRHWYDVDYGCMYLVHKAMRKYGKDGVRIEKSFTVYGQQKDLDSAEDSNILRYNTVVPHGYNSKRGGSHGEFSEEVKSRLSALRKGKRHSDRTKAKIAAAMKGKPKSEEHKIKISKANKGRSLPPRSEEHKAKISANRRGKGIRRSKLQIGRKSA